MRNPLTICILGIALASSPLPAAPGPSLHPFAGSYTGTATSSTATGALTQGATLTVTGRPKRMRGTFLYSGILNAAQSPRMIDQVLNVSNAGVLSGRVTVDGMPGRGRGSVRLRGNRMTTAVTYTAGGAKGTSITIKGQITFRNHRAKWAAKVASNDPAYNGRLTVLGRR